MSTTA